MIRAAAGQSVCLTVTLLDGLVLARSGLEHSVNFRSVMVFGVAELVSNAAQKAEVPLWASLIKSTGVTIE